MNLLVFQFVELPDKPVVVFVKDQRESEMSQFASGKFCERAIFFWGGKEGGGGWD